MRAPVVTLALAITLSGCSTVAMPDTTIDKTQVTVMQTRLVDLNWEGLQLPDELRPELPPFTMVADDEYPEAYVGCMNDAGFDNYTAMPNGWTIDGREQTTGQAQAEMLANYVCGNSFWQESALSYFRSDAQLKYQYDYYHDVLVPCIEMRGGHVTEVPTREEYVNSMGWWHPYYGIEESSQKTYFARSSNRDACPAAAPGLPSDEFDWFWE
jgi:uncharacterized protein YceK